MTYRAVEPGAQAAAAPYRPAVIEVREVSRWYGQVLGLANVWMRVDQGIVGLLGPNGAGKSTLMKVLAGLLAPHQGVALVHGRSLWHDAEARRRLGYCPEHEGVYDELTARELVTAMARLSGLDASTAHKRAGEALDSVGLSDAMDRRLKGFSKGMRQRAKLAQAFVHDPDVLLLDEPLTGCDPLARAQIVARIQELAKAGKVIVVSSHVLYEIEALTREIVLINRGRVLAEGNIYRIRELIDRHPHRVRVECDRPRVLAARLAEHEDVVRLTLSEGAVEVETRQPDHLYDVLPKTVLELGLELRSLSSPDNNLQAVFEYLTAYWSGTTGANV
ncbi:MAG: ABC transporter ATP-binding protein [Polyangiaceae bacterium]|nr:ABC transporter ATP-binding protein [Polyangiaceae bacterium]